MWRHNMVAISKVGNFRTRLLSEILSDLIRCKLVRYPWFCSARPRSFTCFKMADVYHAYWSKFPSQSEASIRFLFRDQVCFFTSLLNLMYLQKIWRYIQGLCFRFSMFLLLCTISEKSSSGIFIRNALSIMSAIFDWCLPQGAEIADDAHRSKISKLCRLCDKVKKCSFYKTIWFWRAV